jgi:hypothetical protein
MSDPKMITFLGDEETKDMLERLAAHSERSQSAYLRWLIRKAHQEHFATQLSPTPSPTEQQAQAA